MKKVVTTLIAATFLFACKDDAKEKKFDADSYEKNKETLADKEKNNPTKFLVIDNKDRKNIIGQTVVVGHISNTASVCTYKDVEIKLTFFSKTSVKLEEGIETIYETVPPGETVKFKTKYFAPKGTDSVAILVMKAAAEVKK